MAPHILLVTLLAAPGRTSDLERALAEVTTPTRAEPGVQTFDPYREVDRSGTFRVIEVYRDREAFEEHLRTPHARAFFAAAPHLVTNLQHSTRTLLPVAPTSAHPAQETT